MTDGLNIDGHWMLRDLRELARFGGLPNGGVHRVAFSPADQAAREWLADQLRLLGLEVRRDAAGNTVATYPGREPDRPPLALGSHSDTVPDGGRFDGALGLVAALACVRALARTGTRLRHPVEVINFAAEEATMSGGTTGSQAMAGRLNPAFVDRPAWDGRPVRDHLLAADLAPERLLEAARPAGCLAAYLELHIEQGEQLLHQGAQVGLVTGFVSIRRYTLTVTGRANHAGTTAMAGREDALVAAAPLILAVRDLAVEHDVVGTVGQLAVHPGAPNVIPGRVDLVVELRALDTAALDQVAGALAEAAAAAGATLVLDVDKAPVTCDPRLLAAGRAACDELSLSYVELASGAGHDAASLAAICPVGMLFVPSQGGLSHTPDEYTTPEDCVNGARALLAALCRLDADFAPS